LNDKTGKLRIVSVCIMLFAINLIFDFKNIIYFNQVSSTLVIWIDI